MAFNAKNLHYDKQEPAFLRRLKGEFSGLDGRHNVQFARPKNARLRTGGDEDDPVIVDEQGDTVEKEEFERRIRDGDGSTADSRTNQEMTAVEQDSQKKHETQQVTEAGQSANVKKRKLGKMVGAAGEDAETGKAELKHGPNQSREDGEGEKQPSKKVPGATKKRKGKNIKLSFDDADG